MSTSQQHRDEKTSPPTSSTAILLLGTIGDTTWRMFVPIIGMTAFGIWIDKQLGTKPWLMLVAIALGVYIAVLLVRRQINLIKPRK